MVKNHRYTGLTDAQVAESRARHGANVLTPPEKTSLWRLYLDKFSDPLIVILLVIGVCMCPSQRVRSLNHQIVSMGILIRLQHRQ